MARIILVVACCLLVLSEGFNSAKMEKRMKERQQRQKERQAFKEKEQGSYGNKNEDVHHKPMHRDPMHGKPMHDEPMHGEPRHGEPMHGEPMNFPANYGRSSFAGRDEGIYEPEPAVYEPEPAVHDVELAIDYDDDFTIDRAHLRSLAEKFNGTAAGGIIETGMFDEEIGGFLERASDMKQKWQDELKDIDNYLEYKKEKQAYKEDKQEYKDEKEEYKKRDGSSMRDLGDLMEVIKLGEEILGEDVAFQWMCGTLKDLQAAPAVRSVLAEIVEEHSDAGGIEGLMDEEELDEGEVIDHVGRGLYFKFVKTYCQF